MKNLNQQVRHSIAQYIREHDLQPGDRLPTEAELCEMCGVSRTAVREAMKILEAMGVLIMTPGRGSFVRSFDIGVLLSNFPTSIAFRDEDATAITDIRQYLERFCVVRAARVGRGHPDHPLLDELKNCLARMKQDSDDRKPLYEEDIRFHRILALLAENRVLLLILEIFWQLRPSYPIDDSPEALVARYKRHYQLAAAIINGNEKEAIAQNEYHYTMLAKEMNGQ